MSKIYVTRTLPGNALDILREVADVTVYPSLDGFPPSKKEIINGVKEADGLLCWLTDKIDSEIINSGKNLKIIANYAVGYNNIDVETATNKGIYVTNTPGVLTQTTAELTWTLLMATARNIVSADKYTRKGEWKCWGNIFLGSELYGKTLGIVGLGRIGGAIARIAKKGFNMNVLYYDIEKKEEFEKEINAKKVGLEELLKKSDFVSLHTVLNESTRHLIGGKELNLMKPTAYLINVSRGPVIDEEALCGALKEKKIAGAGLDVFEHEPTNPKTSNNFKNNPLLNLENVTVLPHIGSATIETRTKMAVMAAKNIIAVLQGRVPPNKVNEIK